MWCFDGNGTWSWLCLIPVLVMLGFMAMMFVMARRCCLGWMEQGAFGKRMAGGVKMESQTAGKWQGMRGSMMQSCMEMMSRRIATSAGDQGMQGLFDRWSIDLEQKIMNLLDAKESLGPPESASALGIPEDVAVSLLHRLALEGKVRIGSVEKAK